MSQSLKAEKPMKKTAFTPAELNKIRADLGLITCPSAGYFREFRHRMIATIDAKDAEIERLKNSQ